MSIMTKYNATNTAKPPSTTLFIAVCVSGVPVLVLIVWILKLVFQLATSHNVDTVGYEALIIFPLIIVFSPIFVSLLTTYISRKRSFTKNTK